MRISTSSLYENGSSQIGTLQSQLAKTQMQLSTNRRMLTPADDPIASARALEVTQSQAINTQFATNRQNARSSLSQVEQALGSTTDLIQEIQTIAVSAGNGGYSAADRASLATELEGRLQDLVGTANSTDGAGGYLFSGYKSTTMPFTQTAAGASYNGDQGQRTLQVGASRQLATSDSGSSVFENNVTGNGSFETGAAAGNTGSGVISGGVATGPQSGKSYQIQFAVVGAVTRYSVTDTSVTPPVALAGAGGVYSSGQPIVVDGMSFDVKGAPAAGDTFSVAPSKKQSIFATVTGMIAALRAPSASAADRAALSNSMSKAQDNLSNALDNVLGVRASVGSRLKELDSLDSTGDDLNIQYAATLSTLQDLDIVKAISLFTQQQSTLEAAQKSFKSISGLSLFNYIS